ncbi:MAG: hypothetical protein PHU54_02630 [Candidatus Omnitrophica bacterium]|nr:hypothetical protein [Candidatus Omnitrophota bacterium]
MIVIGIDPGVETGFAAIRDGNLFLYSKQLMHQIKGISILETFPQDNQIIHLYIESQYLNRTSKKTNFITLRKLIEIEGYWKYEAIKNKINQIHEVLPNVWQSRMLSSSKLKRNELKKLSVQRVNKEWKESIKNHNLADAINIANYGWIEEQIKIKSVKNHENI